MKSIEVEICMCQCPNCDGGDCYFCCPYCENNKEDPRETLYNAEDVQYEKSGKKTKFQCDVCKKKMRVTVNEF